MAKRARGHIRPGQRRPTERRAALSAAPVAPAQAVASRPGGLTDAETARAAELEAQLLAEERAAEQARSRTRDRSAPPREMTTGSTLGVRAEQEYAYVARDLKDIVRIVSILFTVLIALWLLVDVAKVVSIA
jgi:hypothetical protein